MRTYILAIAVSILLAAIYAFQNTADVTVQFLIFEGSFPQGVWEAILFSAGVVLMWLFSIIASFETSSAYSKKIKERDKRIAELDEEKKALLSAFHHISPDGASRAEPIDKHGAVEYIETLPEPGDLYASADAVSAQGSNVQEKEIVSD